MQDRPRPATLVDGRESGSELSLEERIHRCGDARLFGLQGSDSGGKFRLIGDHLVHGRLLRGDCLLLRGDCGGESRLSGVQQRHLLVERRLLLCRGNAQLLCFSAVGTNLVFNLREASRITTDAVRELHIFCAERIEPCDVEKNVGKALSREQNPERRCLICDVGLTNARGQDRLSCRKVTGFRLLRLHQSTDLRVECIHRSIQFVQANLCLRHSG